MKTAILIGGQLRMDDKVLDLTLKVLRDAFPSADFFYAIWKQDYAERKELVDSFEGTVEIIEEYDIHYHPYEENRDAVDTRNYKKKLWYPNPTRHLHQTKQILNHNTLMKKYGNKYDVIVRTRFDSIVSPSEEFSQFVEQVYKEPCVYSFQDQPNRKEKRKFFQWYSIKPENPKQKMVFDGGIIIHPAKWWNSELVERLHNTKKLLAAEFGWYQVLVGDRGINYYVGDGGASLTRCVKKTDMSLLEEMMK